MIPKVRTFGVGCQFLARILSGVSRVLAKRHTREHLLRSVHGTDPRAVVPLCVLSQGFV